jgi:hypothetical protein
MGKVVGYGCAALCVALLAYAIWVSAKGDTGAGLVAVALAFALLIGTVAVLRVRTRL